MINQELYIPALVEIESVTEECDLITTYKVAADEEYKPGQFFQVSILGVGEAPISVSSSPTEKGAIELTVRRTGKVTSAIHNLSKGDVIGLRGPYGNSFPLEDAAGRDLVLVAGGIGLAPLRSVVRYVVDNREKYGRVCLLYGAKRQSEIVFMNELEKWRNSNDIDVRLTIDKAESGWTGHVGVVTTLLYELEFNFKGCIAFVCGPPVMIKYAVQGLSQLGVGDRDIYATLERYMKCGVGKCGHCYMENKYVCIDGPVFSYREIKDMKGPGDSFNL